MTIDIPRYKVINLSTLLLDYNGTIATDGVIPDSVRERLCKLADQFKIIILTADTHGTARKQSEDLPIEVCTFPTGNAANCKAGILKREGCETCVCMGNGPNDIKMFKKAALSIAIMGKEGMYRLSEI